MVGGYIRLHRQLENHWIAENNDYFHWWVDMLWMAKYQDTESDGITIKRGQLEASVAFLTKRWHLNRKTLDRKTVISFLKKLENDNMIIREVVDSKKAIITICNYDKYQYEPWRVTDTELDTISDTELDTILDTIKKIKKKRKNKKNTPSNEGASDSPSDPPSKEVNIDFGGLLSFWNKTMETSNAVIPKLKSMTERRKGFVRARVREHGKRAVFEVITKAGASDFLNGKNQRGWVASFDWIMLPTNFQKVLEDNYDNRNNHYQPQINGTNTNRGCDMQAERERLVHGAAATIARRESQGGPDTEPVW